MKPSNWEQDRTTDRGEQQAHTGLKQAHPSTFHLRRGPHPLGPLRLCGKVSFIQVAGGFGGSSPLELLPVQERDGNDAPMRNGSCVP